MAETTHPSFGATTTATEVARAFADVIRGRTFVVTGTSPSSLGLAIALSLASQRPRLLILASRTRAKLVVVVRDIEARYPLVAVRTVLLDLGDPGSVRRCAAEVRRIVGNAGVDGLFNNAGVSVGRRELVAGYGRGIEGRGKGEGVEVDFATNHLGPFLLTNLLLPVMNVGSRIVMTSSEAHRISPVRFSDFNLEPGKKVDEEDEPRRGLPEGILRNDGGFEPAIAYGQSKTANVLLAVGLNVRLRRKGIESFAVMPGTIMTDLVRDMDERSMKGLTASTTLWKDIDQGAATMLVAALDPKLSSEEGVYLDDCQYRKPSKWAVDPVKAERLWRLSEELVGEQFDGRGTSKL